MEEDESQKIFDPSPKKLEEARKKGDVIKSQDVASVLILAASAAVLVSIGGKMTHELMSYIRVFIERPHEILVDDRSINSLYLNITFKTLIAVSILFSVMCVAAIAGHAGQTGLLFTTEKLMPKPDKISPIAGFKRIFGKEALMQFAKTLFKVIILGIVAWIVVKPEIMKSENLVGMDPLIYGHVINDLTKKLVMKLLMVLVVFAGADYFMQRMNFMKRNKMSKHEMKEEYKQTEGDPIIQGKIRQIRQQKAKQRMMQNVPKATVIITNPTHFAVALRYEAGQTAAPVCVAKGVDRVALNIREIAGEHKIPIIEDPPLARALFKQVEIDEPIPTEFYQAVAKIIGTILSLAARRKSGQNFNANNSPNLINAPLTTGL